MLSKASYPRLLAKSRRQTQIGGAPKTTDDPSRTCCKGAQQSHHVVSQACREAQQQVLEEAVVQGVLAQVCALHQHLRLGLLVSAAVAGTSVKVGQQREQTLHHLAVTQYKTQKAQ